MYSTRDFDNPLGVLQAAMRQDFTAFLRKAYPWIRGGEMIAWNWHLDAVAHRLDRIAAGTDHRLLVTLPPRNLKSITISVAWVAWMLGRDPRLNFVCVSYSNELAAKLARDCRLLVEAPWYQALFPGTRLSPWRSASADFETTKGGGRLATSITGTLTGRGGDIVIIDDPIKPEDANSETVRESVNDWFGSTLASRLNDKSKGAIICVMQRLHEHDLAGMLIDQGGWDQLTLPAIAVQDETIPLPRGGVHQRRIGDLLHPRRENREALERQRRTMGSTAFVAQYQQQPLPAVGNMVRADWLKTYSPSFVAGPPGQIVQSWDTASKDGPHNDWSVCLTANVWKGEVHILDVFRRRLIFPELKRHAIRLAREHKAQELLIEDTASGQQLIQTLRAERLPGVPWPIPMKPKGDKLSRMVGVSGQIDAGQLVLPMDAAWLGEFKAELLGFPNARHDDQVDALAQLMQWVQANQLHPKKALAAPRLIRLDPI